MASTTSSAPANKSLAGIDPGEIINEILGGRNDSTKKSSAGRRSGTCLYPFRRHGRSGGAGDDRLWHGADRRARRCRQDGAARDANLARRHQCQGRPVGSAGQARLLRRPEHAADGAGDLYQAARCRQGRPHCFGLWHKHGRAGDADRHPARSPVSRPLRARGEQRVSLSQVLFDAADRTRSQACLLGALLQGRHGEDRKSTRLNSSHGYISYAVFCLKKKKKKKKKKNLQKKKNRKKKKKKKEKKK